MPLLNLGYALGGLSQGYGQQQQQAMQRAAQQLAIQQAQAQQAGRQALARYLQSPDFKGFGGGFGGGFNPGNIRPVSQPAPALAPGGVTPSPQPPPPSQQQPPPADGNGAGGSTLYTPPGSDLPIDVPAGPEPYSESDPKILKWGLQFKQDDPEQGPQGAVGPSGPPGAASAPSTKPDITPAPSADRPEQMLPGNKKLDEPSTPSDASGGTGGGDEFAIKIPGGPSIPMSQFFGTLDYGALARGIAKYVPPGTDQSAIYEAVLDLSKLAEGNRTQQQQAGLILRELIKQPFDLQKIDRRAAGQSALEDKRQTGRETLEDKRQTGRTELEAMRERFRAESRQRSQDFRTLMQKRSFDHADLVRVNSHAQKLEDEATKRGLDAPKRQAQLIRQEINSYVNRYVDLTASKTPIEVKQRVEALIRQLDQLNTQLFNTGQPAD